ncbi:MAG: hypothetical protein GY729_01370 [Desulfobacteraceae bacterium]|nr:hypothetical protein [Desulfobacteraceae bacterium]
MDLKNMNTLSHMTKNLLDGARNNEFILNSQGIDAILKSVDILKQLVVRVTEGLVVVVDAKEGIRK